MLTRNWLLLCFYFSCLTKYISGNVFVFHGQLFPEKNAISCVGSFLFSTHFIFRNLAWKADKKSKEVLSNSNVVTVLMMTAMDVSMRMAESEEASTKEEPTLKVVLSALWNLSAHCGKNKVGLIQKSRYFNLLGYFIRNGSVLSLPLLIENI